MAGQALVAIANPAIYYACTLPVRAGGELVNFQHVASLRRQGWRAFAWLQQGSEIEWPTQSFPVPIVQGGPHHRWTTNDMLVLPEVWPDSAWQSMREQSCQLVMHNQNPFYTFRGLPNLRALNAFPLRGALCCSAFTRNTLLAWGSTADWQVVQPMVLPHFEQAWRRVQRTGGKQLQIAFMPRKRPHEAKQLLQWFAALCPQWSHVPWVEVDGMGRPQVAQVLAESLVFVSLSKDEGLGLPPLEAMAAGCLVVGFTGGGGQEYATPANGLWVGEAQLPELALGIASLLAMDGPQQAARVQAGQSTAALFDNANFDLQLDTAWHRLLGDDASLYKLSTYAGQTQGPTQGPNQCLVRRDAGGVS
jgi:hypothetical protein